MQSDLKKNAILERIKSIEGDLVKAQEYLQTGAHEHWKGFKPWFKVKIRDGKVLPPHRDWVKNVFIPSREKALSKNEKLICRLENHK